jgi:DNA-binding MarR family transcriptional regulator
MATRSEQRSRTVHDLGIVDGLIQLSTVVHSVWGEVAASADLSLLQSRLLGVLRDREPTMAQLARLLDLDKSSITGLVDRAETRGLVERVAVPEDGRAYRVILTKEGRRLASVLEKKISARMGELTERLGAANERRLSTLASQIVIDFAERRGVDISTVRSDHSSAPGRSR